MRVPVSYQHRNTVHGDVLHHISTLFALYFWFAVTKCSDLGFDSGSARERCLKSVVIRVTSDVAFQVPVALRNSVAFDAATAVRQTESVTCAPKRGKHRTLWRRTQQV